MEREQLVHHFSGFGEVENVKIAPAGTEADVILKYEVARACFRDLVFFETMR